MRHVDLLAINGSQAAGFSKPMPVLFGKLTIVKPSAATASEEDCLSLLRAIDGQECEANSEYLATRETLDIEFDSLGFRRRGERNWTLSR